VRFFGVGDGVEKRGGLVGGRFAVDGPGGLEGRRIVRGKQLDLDRSPPAPHPLRRVGLLADRSTCLGREAAMAFLERREHRAGVAAAPAKRCQGDSLEPRAIGAGRDLLLPRQIVALLLQGPVDLAADAPPFGIREARRLSAQARDARARGKPGKPPKKEGRKEQDSGEPIGHA